MRVFLAVVLAAFLWRALVERWAWGWHTDIAASVPPEPEPDNRPTIQE